MLERGVEPFLTPDTPAVIILEGPRMSGKTVVAHRLVNAGRLEGYESLADPMTRRVAIQDPGGWLASLPNSVAIDEAQLIEDLPLYIKILVDEPGSTRRFLLTGSASLGRTGLGGSDPLTGRAARRRLWPFTASELNWQPSRMTTLIDELFSGEVGNGVCKQVDIAALVAAGGFAPIALARLDTTTADRWVRDTTIGLLTDHVLPDDRFDAGVALRVLDGCLRDPCGVLNVTSLGQRLSIDPRTVDRYLDVMERRFLLHFSPNLAQNPARQTRARAKVYPVDTAFAAESLRRADPGAASEPAMMGHLLEAWVVNQIAPCLGLGPAGVSLHHWRTPRGDKEVDVVLSDTEGRVVGIEVKSSTVVTARDTRGLAALADAHNLVASYVIYLGQKTVRLADRCWALPAAALVGA